LFDVPLDPPLKYVSILYEDSVFYRHLKVGLTYEILILVTGNLQKALAPKQLIILILYVQFLE